MLSVFCRVKSPSPYKLYPFSCGADRYTRYITTLKHSILKMSSTFIPAAKSPLTHDSTALGEGSSNLPPRPQHFIARPDGSITPLIAIDELPESIRIVGVPAVISKAATLNMMNLGVQARSQTKYIVEMPEDSGSGNTCDLSQRSTNTGGNFQSLERRFGVSKVMRKEENNTAGVNEVEEWRLGVNSVDETQVRMAREFTSLRLLTLSRLLLMPLSPPTPNPERFILLVLPRHSRRAYLARRNIVHTGFAGGNATTCSKVANTSMRCRMRILCLLLAFVQHQNGTGMVTRRRMVGWSDLPRTREFGENHLPGPFSRYLPIGSHIFPAWICIVRRTCLLMKGSGRLFNHLSNDSTTRDSRSDQCLAHAQLFQTASPRFRDHFLRTPTFKCGPSNPTNLRLLRRNSMDPRPRLRVPAPLVFRSRARRLLFVSINRPARKSWCPLQSPSRPLPPGQHLLRLQLPLDQAHPRPHLSPHR